MKLLQKTSRIYLVMSSAILILAGLSLYCLMTAFFEDEITEKLYINKQRISQKLANGEKITNLPPVMKIEILSGNHASKLIINDTTLYDPIEKESELFKELISIENINGETYRITLRQMVLEPHDYIGNIGLTLGGVLALLFMGLYLINHYISKNTWKPFYQNLEILKSYSLEKEQPIQLKDSGITEFKELNQAICKLTEKIKTDYQTLKEFTENASHEMQSPLSVLHTKLEETIQHPELSEDQLKQINKALVAARQLSRLNHSLLLLAKIENRQFSQAAEIDMAEALTNTLKLFEDLTATKNITIEKSLENRVLVTTDPLLVNTLLSNLIGNAIKHNVSNGKIRIELNNNMLKIGNTGPTLNSPPDKMFERFVKGVPSSRSLGLGLAIAKKICEIKGWKISYNLYNEWHEIRILFGYFKE